MGGHLRSGFLRPSSPSRALIVDERAWRIGAAGACSRRAFLVLKRLSFEVAIDVCQVAGTGATDVAVGQGWGIAALATLQRIARNAAHPTILPPSRGESGSAGVGQPVRLLGVSDAMWSAATPPARELGARGSRRAVASADPAAHLTPTAAAVVAAIPAWWSARARAIGLTGDWLNVERAIDALPPCPVPDWSPLEEEWGPLTGEQVGRAYVDALTPETRAMHGRHYTPAVLADELWALGRDALGRHGKPALPLPGLVRDPACGAGALLLPALREHVRGSHGVDPRLVLAGLPRVIEGWDIDPAAVWIANVVLAAELLPLLADVPADRRRPLPALAHIGDGLALGRPPAKVIVMNPPYCDAEKFVSKALSLVGDGRKVAAFLRLQFLEGQGRYDRLMKDNPPKAVYVFVKRQVCSAKDDFTEGSAVAYCWMVWEKGFKGSPEIRWIAD